MKSNREVHVEFKNVTMPERQNAAQNVKITTKIFGT
jgi:hypothetical protein